MARLPVIDENLDKRISAELTRRGRSAKTVAQLGLKGWTDPRLLESLSKVAAGCVLITGDDAMPATHEADLIKYGTTVAVVAPWMIRAGSSNPNGNTRSSRNGRIRWRRSRPEASSVTA